jgi:hypothetical protein
MHVYKCNYLRKVAEQYLLNRRVSMNLLDELDEWFFLSGRPDVSWSRNSTSESRSLTGKMVALRATIPQLPLEILVKDGNSIYFQIIPLHWTYTSTYDLKAI